MILENPNLKLETQGILDSDISVMTIESNAVMFDLISNKMYKDKVGSICRELLSNSKDSSVQANTKTPIFLHLPTLLEPYFAIKDFGVGLSEDEVVNIFGVYGKSSKRKDNSSIGCFGLGAKVSLCLNNQFSVTAIKDNKSVTYQFFKNSSGIPSKTCLNRMDTNEPNGVEIKIAVNEAKQFAEFREKAEFYVKWLGYPVDSNLSLNPLLPETKYQQSEFQITKMPHNTRSSGLVIFGGIPYYLSYEDCGISTYYEGIGPGIKPDYVIINASIGDIDVTASRESLEMTPKTVSFIKNRVQLVGQWYKDYLKSKTKFWLHQNTQAFEKVERKWFNYGFPCLCKQFNKWQTQSSAKVYEKYITLDNFTDKLAWLVAAKKVGGNADTVAFILKTDKQNLINLGADPSCIYSFDDLPKQKRGKLAKYKICCLKIKGANSLNKELGFCRTDKLEKKHFNIQSTILKKTYSKTLIKEILEKNGPISITVDDAQSCGFVDYLKSYLGEKDEISYCNVVRALEKLGVIKTLTKNKQDDKDTFRRAFGLIKGETVNLSNQFPLLQNTDWTYYPPKNTERIHAIDYVDYVLKKTPDALKNKHLQVLSTSPSGKSN